MCIEEVLCSIIDLYMANEFQFVSAVILFDLGKFCNFSVPWYPSHKVRVIIVYSTSKIFLDYMNECLKHLEQGLASGQHYVDFCSDCNYYYYYLHK